MGMSYEQFWEQDCTLVIPFRKAYKIRQEEQNQSAWLQGLYFFEGVSVAIGRSFSKAGRNLKYPEKPYDLNPPKEKSRAEIVQEQQELIFEKMQAMAMKYNREFRERKEREEAEKAAAAECETTNEDDRIQPTTNEDDSIQSVTNEDDSIQPKE